MNFLLSYIRNLLILIAILLGALVFMRNFYPDTQLFLPAMEEMISGLNLWPIVILMLLLAPLPSLKRK